MFASCGPFDTNVSPPSGRPRGRRASRAPEPSAERPCRRDRSARRFRRRGSATQTPLPSTATAEGPLPTPMVLSTRFVAESIRMSRPEVAGPPAPPRVRKKPSSAAAIRATPTTATRKRPAAPLRLGDPERLRGRPRSARRKFRNARSGSLASAFGSTSSSPGGAAAAPPPGARTEWLRRCRAERRLAREALVEHAAERI